MHCLSCRALEIALQLGPSALQPEPLLKISGIYVELANVLEIQRQRVSAFVELRTALEMFGPDPLRRPAALPLPEATALGGGPGGQWIGEGYRLTEKDHVRAIGLYQKLGQLALEVASSPTGSTYASTLGEGSTEQMFKTWDDAAEYYLSSALTSMLHLGLPGSSSTPSTGGPVILGRDVSLPEALPNENPEDVDQGGQVDKRGLGMTMESLSEVYARKGQYDMAGQLLLQAISLLLPPQSKETPPMRDRCQAAMVGLLLAYTMWSLIFFCRIVVDDDRLLSCPSSSHPQITQSFPLMVTSFLATFSTSSRRSRRRIIQGHAA